MNVFDEMGKYWAEIADQNSTDLQVKFLKGILKREELVLDLACGTGRHIIPLSKEGDNIVGVDVSTNLLRIAKNRGDRIKLIKADMQFLPFKAETFSAAISMDTSFGYLSSEEDDEQSLRALHEALREDGMLILDVFNCERLISKYRTNWFRQLKWALLPIMFRANRLGTWMVFHFFKWKEYPSFFLLQKRTIDANGARLHDLWVVCDKEDGKIRVFEHNVRLYKLERLQELLEAAGFKISLVYGDYVSQSFSSNSGRLILVANAKFLQQKNYI
jgi:SAM-dependent methyltransferase